MGMVSSAASVALLLLGTAVAVLASIGDRDPRFKHYLDHCTATGCLIDHCIPGCSPPIENGEPVPFNASVTRVTDPFELKLMRWDCLSECKYQSMVLREKERKAEPVKYYGKWPFTRIFGLQEPASVVFSVLNLIATLWGLFSFVNLVYFKLPRKPMGDKGPLYEYAGLIIFSGIIQANSWFWSSVFHGRDTYVTERLDYNSAIINVSLGLMIAIIRTANLRAEAARVMVMAPLTAFTSTHLCYLNFYQFDYGWNIMVCAGMGVLQLLLWLIWATSSRHPSALFVWLSCGGTGLSMLLEIFDFPPASGLIDAHAAWHACTIPLTILWWTFLARDAEFRTSTLLSKGSKKKGKKTN